MLAVTLHAAFTVEAASSDANSRLRAPAAMTMREGGVGEQLVLLHTGRDDGLGEPPSGDGDDDLGGQREVHSDDDPRVEVVCSNPDDRGRH